MTRCLRCNEPADDSRRQIAAQDYTDATAAHYEGTLCPSCWEVLIGELLGFQVEERREGVTRC